MSTEQDWIARADREAARIIAAVEVTTNVDYVRIQEVVALAWLEGYKAASSDALETMTK